MPEGLRCMGTRVCELTGPVSLRVLGQPRSGPPVLIAIVAAGDVERELDLYFPFEEAVDAWARCFAALGIQYK